MGEGLGVVGSSHRDHQLYGLGLGSSEHQRPSSLIVGVLVKKLRLGVQIEQCRYYQQTLAPNVRTIPKPQTLNYLYTCIPGVPTNFRETLASDTKSHI